MLLLRVIYVISVLFLLCFRARFFIDALLSPAGKKLTSWLLFVMSNCEIGILGQVYLECNKHSTITTQVEIKKKKTLDAF